MQCDRRLVWLQCLECMHQVQFPLTLLKHVDVWQTTSWQQQRLLHCCRIDTARSFWNSAEMFRQKSLAHQKKPKKSPTHRIQTLTKIWQKTNTESDRVFEANIYRFVGTIGLQAPITRYWSVMHGVCQWNIITNQRTTRVLSLWRTFKHISTLLLLLVHLYSTGSHSAACALHQQLRIKQKSFRFLSKHVQRYVQYMQFSRRLFHTQGPNHWKECSKAHSKLPTGINNTVATSATNLSSKVTAPATTGDATLVPDNALQPPLYHSHKQTAIISSIQLYTSKLNSSIHKIYKLICCE